MHKHLPFKTLPRREAMARRPYENKTVRRLSADITCLQSIRLLIGKAKREGSPSPFRIDGLPADVSRCLGELRSIDQGIDLSDLSHHMIGRLFSTIQDLLAKKQFSRSFEKRLMAQFNLARFHTEQRSRMNVPGSKTIARLLCKNVTS